MTTALEHRLRAAIVGPNSNAESLVVLRYDLDDPCAVHLVIPDSERPDDPVVWPFARTLLAAGYSSVRPVGDGDVRVWSHQGQTHIELSSPDGYGRIVVACDRVGRFVRASEALVPVGSERLWPEVLPEWLGGVAL